MFDEHLGQRVSVQLFSDGNGRDRGINSRCGSLFGRSLAAGAKEGGGGCIRCSVTAAALCRFILCMLDRWKLAALVSRHYLSLTRVVSATVSCTLLTLYTRSSICERRFSDAFSKNMESEREAKCALRRRCIGAMTFT